MEIVDGAQDMRMKLGFWYLHVSVQILREMGH